MLKKITLAAFLWFALTIFYFSLWYMAANLYPNELYTMLILLYGSPTVAQPENVTITVATGQLVETATFQHQVTVAPIWNTKYVIPILRFWPGIGNLMILHNLFMIFFAVISLLSVAVKRPKPKPRKVKDEVPEEKKKVRGKEVEPKHELTEKELREYYRKIRKT